MRKLLHPGLSHITLALQLVAYVSAQASTLQTLYQASAFSALDVCAQGCFTHYLAGCYGDNLGYSLQCPAPQNVCSTAFGVPDSCYCRPDKQPVALSLISNCVSSACTVGLSSVDISSAQSIYTAYCNAKVTVQSTPQTVSATTTPASGAAPSQTGSSSSPASTTSVSINSQTANSAASTSASSPPTGTTPTGSSSSTTSSINTVAIAVGASLGSLLLLAIAFILWLLLKPKPAILPPPDRGSRGGALSPHMRQSEIGPDDSISHFDERSGPFGAPTFFSR